ncbi:NAD-dependent epimerase/dehydratase family protein [Actinomadura darangshiensis]|uniref:NAD-dependent epimerase/dehydratase family protein n=1 Tax=Actinomadura darangshiensis TaxID=705336 RepID=A0A4R5BHA4_9ACTN|nr:saccharopine dehydrogenase NADP-binding domain-containing protein [Actinomadura darangshiensis]TDD84376.1 NAD-dependent epimerase/dehydratase family protein [Actinomadura darangshiensis]
MKIAVYGASGYQGKLVLTELARRDIETVLAGRNRARLEEAASAIGLPDAERRSADASDHEALVSAFRGCDAVINCAGPFTSSGEAVVRAAIAAGCHYVDTSGEQLYVKKIFDTFTTEAENAGVTVVPAANDGCVPVDLMAHILADRLEPVEEIITTHVVVGGGGMSRGSLRSVVETIDAIKAGGLAYTDGDWHPGVPARRTAITLPGQSEATPVMAFPVPEVVTIPRHIRVRRVQGLTEAALGDRLNTPLTPEIIESLPEGPDGDGRRTQHFTYVLDATGIDGRRARGIVQGPDTYGTTAVIAVEGARRLIAEPAKPGVLAPAQAYPSTAFLDFLVPHGIQWIIEDAPAT